MTNTFDNALESGNSPLDAIIAAYLEAVERGDKPDRDRLMLDHPQLASELRAFFADLDRVHQAAGKPADYDVTVIGMKDPTPGTILGGRYKLLENIGEGGMGSVWVAEQQQPVKRKVAIKLVKAGMDSKQVLARFEAERQALAVMDHPNIAKVFDGGMTDQGRPYFVMEYVKGIPFTEYCDRVKLSLKERLILFIPVCHAVQHAHHKGIVHRDLKPSNILICLYDGKPVPKVIDFGLAKAMHQPLTEKSIHTGHGIMVGTPVYMSPEQAEHNNLDVDTRTDIYSLGVVLYELLVGTTPLERQQLQQAAFDEILRLIKEVEPPRPSVRLSASGSLPSIAAQRSIEPKDLRKSLTGDLDWIVMKSLDKERSRRYETANGFAQDIERFLNEEPVEACPPSRSYLLKKFVKKHRGQVIAVGAVFMTFFLGLAGTIWQSSIAVRRSIELQSANELLRDRSKAVQKALEGVLVEIVKTPGSEISESRQFAGPDSSYRGTVFAKVVRPEKGDPYVEIVERGPDKKPANNGLALEYLATIARERVSVLHQNYETTLNALKSITTTAGRDETRSMADGNLLRLPDGNYLHIPNYAANIGISRGTFSEFTLVETGGSVLPDAFVGELKDLKTQPITTSDAISRIAEFVSHYNDKLRLETANSKEQLLKTERILAEGILRPIGFTDSLNDAELRSFVDWAAIDDPRMKLKVLEVAFDDPETAMRVARRTERSIQSCVGLSMNRRDAAGEFLSRKQQDLQAEPRLRAAACWMALELGDTQLPALNETIHWFLSLEKNEGDSPLEIEEFVNTFVSRSQQLTAEQTAQSWKTLVEILHTTQDFHTVESVRKALVSIVPQLNSEQLSRDVNALIELVEKRQHERVIYAACPALAALATKLNPAQMTRVWDTLINAAGSVEYVESISSIEAVLVTLAPKLLEQKILKDADTLIALPEKSDDYDILIATAPTLVSIAGKLTPEQTIRAWDAVIDMPEKIRSTQTADAAQKTLVALAPSLTPEQSIRGGDAIIEVLQSSKDDQALRIACAVIATLTPNLTLDQKIISADAMMELMTTSKEQHVLVMACTSLAALAPSLTSDQTSRAWDSVITVMTNEPSWALCDAAGLAIDGLTQKLTQEEAILRWDVVIDVLVKWDDPDSRQIVVNVLDGLALKMTPEEAHRRGDLVMEILELSTDSRALRAAADAMVTLAPKLTPKQTVHGVDALIRVFGKTDDWLAIFNSGQALAALSPQLTADDANRCGDELISVLETRKEWSVIKAVCRALVAMSPQLTPQQLILGWDTLVEVLQNTEHTTALEEVRDAMIHFAPILAEERRDIALQHLLRVAEGRSYGSYYAIDVLLSMAPYMNPDTRLAFTTVLKDELPLYHSGYNTSNILSAMDTANHEEFAMNTLNRLMNTRITTLNANNGFESAASIEAISKTVSEAKHIAEMLPHPAAVGDVRETLLKRFEELLLYGGQHIFLTEKPEDESSESPGNAERSGQTLGRSPEPPPRKFRTIHDAQIWIQQNWPDFNLDETPEVQWRGGK